jgi:hypothetical protein
MIKITIAMLLTIGLTGCAGIMPDVAQIVHDISDTAISIEINEQAIKNDTDVHVIVDVINKDLPKPKT